MSEKHIQLLFGIHRSESDRTIFGFIIAEGRNAVAYNIIELFGNGSDNIVDLLLRKNENKFVPELVIESDCQLVAAAVNTLIGVDEKFNEKILNKKASFLRKSATMRSSSCFLPSVRRLRSKIVFIVKTPFSGRRGLGADAPNVCCKSP